MPYKNLTLIKWIAVILMIGDHINKYLLNESMPFLYYAGRIAMPLFVYVLAYNLARPDNLSSGAYSRIIPRLMVFGLISTPAYILLDGILDGWWPLNILFTLLTITIICYFLDKGGRLPALYALIVFFALGAVVEFWWPAIAMGVCVWLYYRKGRGIFLCLALLACTSLVLINQNFYALLAVPVIIIAGYVRFPVRRFKWVFYAFYPAHLYLILALRSYLTSQGYLFFT
ncbi:TPA: conjugal transfer protein TraX [Escherichia coli]|uniref:TraX family protein n=1 Tax=Enterobacteriaceae TaxID=543 RepID=UPI0015881C8C|nr:TraX family protein [Cronobacter muytjensii]EAT8674938.1 conjugal transfer protein TraX [Salmonella enterica]HDS3454379.1 conjugal transfer protein TraX [Escherichia coli]EEC2753743.1 conjugal transfer protein TraX [Salmonella enterica]EKY8230884.1 conjugal transfer protein TraX [Salmonella enterica]NUW61646.1 conjugal transfer protein TraX [Cronobacter muytjensii]